MDSARTPAEAEWFFQRKYALSEERKTRESAVGAVYDRACRKRERNEPAPLDPCPHPAYSATRRSGRACFLLPANMCSSDKVVET